MDTSFTQRTLISCLLETASRHAELEALVTPGRGNDPDRRLSFRDLWQDVARFAAGLQRLGLQTGENVMVLSDNRDRWLIVDLALLGIGCPDVPRGTESPADEVSYILEKVRARVLVLEHPRLLQRLDLKKHPPEIVVLLTGTSTGASIPCRVLTYEQVLESADRDSAWSRFQELVRERRAVETATIVFTSGTTGRPKGVVLTQSNLVSNLFQALTVIEFLPRGGSFVSILPPWHTFERMVEYALFHLGLKLIYSDRRHFAEDLRRFGPQVVAAVPRLWMMLMEGVENRLAQAPARKRRLVQWALSHAQEYVKGRRILDHRIPRFPNSEPSEESLRAHWALRTSLRAPLVFLQQKLVLQRILKALGLLNLRAGAAISGGGSLPEHVDLFFEALGVPILNGYGLTETSPVLSLRKREHNVAGTIGRALPQTEISIRSLETGKPLSTGEQGLIFVRGPQVMAGYFEDPKATQLVLSEDGWFNTGDLGKLSLDNDLLITGRAKDTIVLLSGENIEPEPLENALTSSPLIQQALVVGQDRKYLGALIVPRLDAQHHRDMVREIRQEIDQRVNPRQGFRNHERIVKFRLLEQPFSVEDGSLSQTLKIKRGVVQKRLSDMIDSLFREPQGTVDAGRHEGTSGF